MPLLAVVISISEHAHSQDRPDEALDFLEESEVYLALRYRFEHVSQDGFSRDARASTMRSRIGFVSPARYPVGMLLEAENVTTLGADQYNDTVNGKTQFPIVADPESTELNQAYVRINPQNTTRLRIGKEALKLGNERFIGDVGWRQNNQTMDGLNVLQDIGESTSFFYGYVNQVNRIFGSDSNMGTWDTDSHLIQGNYRASPMFEIRPYWYFIDIDEVPTQSTHTLGSELSGEIDIGSPDSIAYKLEFAQQSDHSHNPDSYSANYFRLDLQWLHSPITLGIGHEILGSNSEHIPLSTPLATLHAWNGWADIFLTTPVLGLRDTYAFLAVDFEKVEVLPLQASVYYHEFVSDRGDIEYGSEWDALLRTRVIENVHTSIKFARYEAHSLGNDVTKVMAYVEYNLKYTL